MATRRLNRKVALMGSTVFLLLALGIVVVILKLSRDPAQFIADGDAARAAGDYESARRNYGKAISLMETPEEKIELFFKLADVSMDMGDWQRVLGAWGQIVTSDPQNLRARLGRLKYCYILADSLSEVGQSMKDHWEEALKQSTELIEVAEQAGALDQPRAQWEPSFGAAEEPRWAGGAALLGPCLLFIQGRAAFELARLGAVTSPDELLDEAQGSLEKVREQDPNNVDVWYYLAQVALQKGENAASRGNQAQRETAARQAEDILAEAVKATDGASHACINLLTRKFAVARAGQVTAARARMQALEPEYRALAEKFPDNADVAAVVAEYHAMCSAYSGSTTATEALDRAIEAAEKAVELDENSVLFARFASRLNFRKYLLFGREASLRRAIELAEHGLTLPDAQDTAGPRQYAGQANRLSLCAFLTRCCVERILTLDKTSPQREELLTKAEKAVHEIEQIYGSGQNPQVVMWQGMLDLAKGHTSTAIRSLYAAYEQINASGVSQQRDAFLSYTLARIFEGTTEIGAVVEFLGSALEAGIIDTQPEALLDYGQALIQAKSYDAALNAVDIFEERFGPTDRSKELRVEAMIARGRIDEAQEVIRQMNPGDPNALRLDTSLSLARALQLRAAIYKERPDANGSGTAEAMTVELRQCRQRQADLTRQLLATAPEMVNEQDIGPLCEALVEQGDVALAREMVDAFLKHRPDNVEMLFRKGLLAEPDPANCPQARRRAIREQAIRSIADPVARSLELGVFYQQQERLDEATTQWRKVLDATNVQGDAEEPAYLRAKQLSPRHVAASHLFDLARHQKNWSLAEEIARIARQDNLDDCGGYLFAARLAFAKGDYKEALARLDECLRQRPIFSYGYMLRGNVYAALDNERACLDDLEKAAGLNPVDPLVAKALATALYARNNRLADKVSSEQQLEAKQAIERAIRLDPRDVSLLTIYAGLVGKDEPMKALALHQTIQMNAPTVQNGVLLGKLATQMALHETDETKRQGFFAIAESAFEQARKMEPGNRLVLESYASYYRARGQNEAAARLLAESSDNGLLWRHYVQVGRSEEAAKLLRQMYADPKTRVDALKGLILVAKEAADKDSVKKYSEELLTLEDNVVNRLGQIRAYLDVGLVPEAQQKLESFKQKYPDEPQILLLEALLARQQGDLDRAFDLVNRGLQKSPDDPALWRLRGEIGFLRGDPNQAIADLEKSRAMDNDPATPLMLERIYLKLGRYEAVRKLYRDVLAESPDNVGWLNRAAAFAASQGEYDAALADMDRCIALTAPESPQYVGYLGGKAQILALAYKRTSDNAYLEKAVAVYESLLEKTPKNDNSVILNNLAYMLAQGNRRLADALAYAKRALEQKPEEANYLDTYGYALYRNGRNAEAVESLTAAIRRYEAQGAPSADAYEHLGMVREALGEGREALSAYRRALEVGADAMPPIMRDRINSAIGRLMP